MLVIENIEKLKRIDPIPKNDYPVGKTDSQIGWMSEPVFDVEIKEFGKCFSTDDFKEGTTAFLEKRKPAFTGK